MGTTSITSWQDARQYCKDRLDEIREINKHQNPSGFVCIAAFMGFLSRLAFGTNNKSSHADKKCFCDFIANFMPMKYRGHDDMMYRTFRCGIVHAMSFDDELAVDNVDFLKTQLQGVQGFSKLAITHSHQYDSLCTGHQLRQDSNGMYVLVADILCNDIESAINAMFADREVQKNCERFILCQRPISEVKTRIATSTQGLSGYSSADAMTNNAPSLSASC